MLGSVQEPGDAVATIHYRFAGKHSAANIYVHDRDEKEDTVVPGPEIRVRGDLGGLQYTFYLDEVRIAQVRRCNENVLHIKVL